MFGGMSQRYPIHPDLDFVAHRTVIANQFTNDDSCGVIAPSN